MMRAPPPSLESYMNSILKPSDKPNPVTTIPTSNAFMSEMNKLKQLQAKKQELEQQMTLLNSQILKTQGALEVLQALGLSK